MIFSLVLPSNKLNYLLQKVIPFRLIIKCDMKAERRYAFATLSSTGNLISPKSRAASLIQSLFKSLSVIDSQVDWSSISREIKQLQDELNSGESYRLWESDPIKVTKLQKRHADLKNEKEKVEIWRS